MEVGILFAAGSAVRRRETRRTSYGGSGWREVLHGGKCTLRVECGGGLLEIVRIMDSFQGMERKFSTVYADPPWRFRNRTVRGAPEGYNAHHYSTMSLEEIMDLPVGDLVYMSQRRDHSRKPDELRSIIRFCSPGPYLELFARERVKGWTCWGDGIDG